MEPVLPGRVREQDAVWDEDKAEAGWAVPLPPVPAGPVFVRVVDIGHRTWWASRAINEAARRAAAL